MLLPSPQFRRRDFICTALGSAALAATPRPVLAQTTGGTGGSAVIDVNGARNAPIPVAVTDLGGGPMGPDISAIVTNDLARCGLFRPIDRAAFIQSGPSDSGTPNFQNWRPTGAQALVTGQAFDDGATVRVEFRLWDILPGTQLQGTAFTAPKANWRRVAHIMADAIYQRLLGEQGYFDTQIVYVSSQGPKARAIKAVGDHGSGQCEPALSDGWDMDGADATLQSEAERNRLYELRQQPAASLRDERGDRGAIVSGPFQYDDVLTRWSPDGGTVVMATTDGGASDIIAVTGGAVRRLTNSGAIDVTPCYSPDGSRIVFASDRGGDQQIYIMGANGGSAQRISYGNGRYGTPVWSPRGDLIAFTRYAGDTSNFSIGVMHPDGSGERLLAEGWLVEGPTFAPNGRVLMFWRETPGNAQGSGYSAGCFRST